ncbi:hypothetical protein GKQ38_04805 [Candidatus Nanohaloarchaea archaeon]|nr:hypothetical protein GKQ38_04805 [Candidatus Nanohaloarchaea archaeon]
MSSDVFKPVNEMLSGERELREWADENGQRVGANADEMSVGEIDGERYFVKQDLPEAEKAAHLAAAPLMEQLDRAPEILYDTETEEVAISELGENARPPNSALLSDELYSPVASVDEESFYEVAAQRWMLGDSNVYDNMLVESVSPRSLMPGEEREVYLHDFDHAGKHSSRGRIRGFREAFEYVAEKLDIDYSHRRLKKEIGELGDQLNAEAYEQRVDEMEEGLRDDLYGRVQEHSQKIADNIRRAEEVF